MTATGAAPPGQALRAQTRIELILTLRRGESVLLTFAIPVVLLAFFSMVDILPTPPGTEQAVDFLFPGILALAIMSTSLVSVAIATAFERQMGVLKRLGATPLTRRQLLGAKTAAVLVIEALQVTVLTIEAFILGFRFSAPAITAAILAALLATVAFTSIALLLAGTLPALTTLAAANGIYLLLLLLGGMVIPLSSLPEPLQRLSQATPAGALAEILQGTLGSASVPGHAWVVLVVWAVAAPLVAAAFFRWE